MNMFERLPTALAAADESPGTARRVLVIEDEEDFRETLALVLEREGLDVTAVANGAAAIQAAGQRRFDLVITDLGMPGLSGADTIAALRVIDAELPVIVSTGYVSDELSDECRSRGAGNFLRKPFDLDELIGMVQRVLG
jgi:CheY-like chemotaxis protein